MHTRARFLLPLSFFLLPGCVSLFPEGGTDAAQYDLPLPEVHGPGRAPRHPDVLKIGGITCAQPHATARILVRRQDQGLLQDEPLANALWSEPLPDLITHRLTQYLGSAHLYRGIVQKNDPIEAKYLLSGRVEAFELRPSPTSLEAHVRINFLLTLQKERRLLNSHTFEAHITGDAKTQEAGVRALSQAFSRVLWDLKEWLGKANTSF